MKKEVVEELSKLDLDNFNPNQAIETIAPKSRYGFRIVHQLFLVETILYSAAVFEMAGDLETIKRPPDEYGPFAYRFSNDGDSSVFLKDHTYRDWLEWQANRAKVGDCTDVINTDIADFYQRIYLHRIENCLDTATANKGVKRFVEKLIKQVRSKQSHGIPVGGTASRLIAEAVLADTDNALAGEGIEFTRFVDDYCVFVRPDQTPYSILAFFADQLAASEGLSLNAQKTRLYTIEEFQQQIGLKLGDAFDEAEKDAIEALSNSMYFEGEVSPDDLAKLRAANLMGMLETELAAETWEFGRIKAIFRALRLAPDPDSIAFLEEKFEMFLPFIKELVLYLDELTRSYEVDLSGFQKKVLEQIHHGAAASVPVIRVWLLELFVRNALQIDLKQISDLKCSESLDNRQLYLIRGAKGDVNYFRRQKARFDERNNFEKLAFMLGATCLPKDEFDTWVNAVKPNMTRPLDRLFCDWVKTKRGALTGVLDARTALLKE